MPSTIILAGNVSASFFEQTKLIELFTDEYHCHDGHSYRHQCILKIFSLEMSKRGVGNSQAHKHGRDQELSGENQVNFENKLVPGLLVKRKYLFVFKYMITKLLAILRVKVLNLITT